MEGQMDQKDSIENPEVSHCSVLFFVDAEAQFYPDLFSKIPDQISDCDSQIQYLI